MEPASSGASSLLRCARSFNRRERHRSRRKLWDRRPFGCTRRPLTRLRCWPPWPHWLFGRLGLRRLIRRDRRCGRRLHGPDGSWRRGRWRRRFHRLHDRRALWPGHSGRPHFLWGRRHLSRLGRWRRRFDRMGPGRRRFWSLRRAGGRGRSIGRRRRHRYLVRRGDALRFWRLAWGDDYHLFGLANRMESQHDLDLLRGQLDGIERLTWQGVCRDTHGAGKHQRQHGQHGDHDGRQSGNAAGLLERDHQPLPPAGSGRLGPHRCGHRSGTRTCCRHWSSRCGWQRSQHPFPHEPKQRSHQEPVPLSSAEAPPAPACPRCLRTPHPHSRPNPGEVHLFRGVPALAGTVRRGGSLRWSWRCPTQDAT
jgi:hypothetical protein